MSTVKKYNYTRNKAIQILTENDDSCELEISERMDYRSMSNKKLGQELKLGGLVSEEEFGEVID